MSSERVYSYELKRQRRQAIFNERVRNTTTGFYERYLEMYEEFMNKDFDKFIPDEMNRLKNDLDTIERDLAENPAAARDVSFAVQEYIYTMRSIGNEARNRFAAEEHARNLRAEAEARIRREKAAKEKSERDAALEKVFFSKIASISNPAVQNFIASDLEEIQKDLSAGKFATVESLENSFSEALKSAEQKLAEWKTEAAKRNETAASKAKIEAEKQRIAAEHIEEKKKTVIIRKLDDILLRSEKGTASSEEIGKELSEIQNETIETAISEDVRRETVKSIIKMLRAQSFTVDINNDVHLIQKKDENFVRIIATMPSGKRAVCNLTDKGKIIYKFDHYEGMTCLKDIQRFNVDLEKIYSVKLSDERILWSNPDEIGKDADRFPDSNKINK